jgi:hypothetical protein
LEAGLGGVQYGMQQLELGVADKLHHLEETINRLSEAFLSTREVSSNNQQEGSFIQSEKGTIATGIIFHPLWQSWHFQNTLEKIQPNG